LALNLAVEGVKALFLFELVVLPMPAKDVGFSFRKLTAIRQWFNFLKDQWNNLEYKSFLGSFPDVSETWLVRVFEWDGQEYPIDGLIIPEHSVIGER